MSNLVSKRRLLSDIFRPSASQSLADEEVSQLSSLSNLARLSTFVQMTPTVPDQLYPGGNPFCPLPYSPIGVPPHSFVHSPLGHVQQHVNSPKKSRPLKGMSRKELDEFICNRLEDKVEGLMSQVDHGLESLQREVQVKDRLRYDCLIRHMIIRDCTQVHSLCPINDSHQ